MTRMSAGSDPAGETREYLQREQTDVMPMPFRPLVLVSVATILGAAIATGASYTLINIARIVEVYKLLRMHPYDTNYHKLFIAGFAVIILSVFLFMFDLSQVSWIFSMIVLIIVYFSALYFLGLEYEDRMIWETIKRRIGN